MKVWGTLCRVVGRCTSLEGVGVTSGVLALD